MWQVRNEIINTSIILEKDYNDDIPIILEEELAYNDGEVYKMYDEELDCTFYDIDCGCSYKERDTSAKLACIRLEDEEVFYV